MFTNYKGLLHSADIKFIQIFDWENIDRWFEKFDGSLIPSQAVNI